MENNNDLIISKVNVKNEESYVKSLTANESFNNILFTFHIFIKIIKIER